MKNVSLSVITISLNRKMIAYLEKHIMKSVLLFELCDGNRIQLSNCRRSDDKILNMCLPINIDQIDTKNMEKTFVKSISHIQMKNVEMLMPN